MRMLVLAALLVVLPGASRAEGGAPPAPAEKPAPAGKAKKGAGGKAAAKPAAAKKDARPEEKGKDGAKGAGAPGEKPCEPVKPCPIDG